VGVVEGDERLAGGGVPDAYDALGRVGGDDPRAVGAEGGGPHLVLVAQHAELLAGANVPQAGGPVGAAGQDAPAVGREGGGAEGDPFAVAQEFAGRLCGGDVPHAGGGAAGREDPLAVAAEFHAGAGRAAESGGEVALLRPDPVAAALDPAGGGGDKWRRGDDGEREEKCRGADAARAGPRRRQDEAATAHGTNPVAQENGAGTRPAPVSRCGEPVIPFACGS
jgi:hypothetical protein